VRLKQNEFVQLEDEMASVKGVRFNPWNCPVLKWSECDQAAGIYKCVACKWKRKYWGWAPDEGWFILTNLSDLESAILAYKKRFGIEEMCARL